MMGYCDLLLKAKSRSLVFDALACIGVYLVGDMDYCIAQGKRSTQKQIDGVSIIQVFHRLGGIFTLVSACLIIATTGAAKISKRVARA